MSQVVLITGSSTGFGFLTAKTLANSGFRVYASMRGRDGKNESFARQLENFAAENNLFLKTIELDVTDENSVSAAVEIIVGETGRIDVLVNNAGIWGPGILEAFTLAQWKEIFEVNVFGSVRAARAVLPQMRKQNSGLIVQISSLQGRFILPYSGAYVASKFAVEGAMETFRYEVAPFGVEVCLVEPGDFLTEIKEKAFNYQPADKLRESEYGATAEFIRQMYLVPDVARAGNPQTVADAILRLIETLPGERPVRTTIGNWLPQIEEINRLTDEMHRQLFPQIGLGNLLQSKEKTVNA